MRARIVDRMNSMERKQYLQYKKVATNLRREGKTYKQIQEALNVAIPKSTLRAWFRCVDFSEVEMANIPLYRQIIPPSFEKMLCFG